MKHVAPSPFEQEPEKELATKEKIQDKISIYNLNTEDRQKLVSAFVWLIQEDKKQNPALYQINEIVV